MKQFSRLFLCGALTLVLLTAACAGQEGSPTPAGTAAPGEQTASPPAGTDATGTAETATPPPAATLPETPTATPTKSVATPTPPTNTTQTPGVPVTGAEANLLDCQYCIGGMAHAILVIPETMTFQTVTELGPDMGCNVVDTYNGSQTVICRAEQGTSLNLNICTDGTNCTPLLVELQPCPVDRTAQPGVTNPPEAGTPTSSTPTGTTGTPTASPTATP